MGGKHHGFAAYPMVGAMGRGVRVYLGRFPTRELRDAAIKEYRKKYPDQRKVTRGQSNR